MDTIEAPVAARPISTVEHSRAARWLAWALWALALVQVALGLLLAILNRLTFERFVAEYVAVGVLTTVSFATAGLLIARRRPRNPIGWLICAAGVLGGLGTWAGQYARYAYVTSPGALPFGDIAAWLYICPAFGPFLALTAIFL